MSKYLKDKRIEIFNNNVEWVGAGDHVHHWESMGKFWAYTRMLSMKEYHDYGITTEDVDRLFIINYNKDVNIYDRIVYRGKEYKIYSVDTYNDNKQDMKIYAVNDKVKLIKNA